MIKLIVLSVLLNAGEMHALPPDDTKIEARRRGGKGDKMPTHYKGKTGKARKKALTEHKKAMKRKKK